MKIEITSYCHGLLDKTRLSLTKEIINDSTSDLILFSGHTIGFVNDIETLKTTQANLIETIQETMNIQREGAIKRRQGEVELAQLEEEIKTKLLELSNKGKSE